MANLTTSSDIDTFMGSTDNAAARTNLGVLPLAGGTMTGALTFAATHGGIFPGSTSGTATVKAPAVAGTAAITLPGVTSTLATLGANVFTAAQTISSGFLIFGTGSGAGVSIGKASASQSFSFFNENINNYVPIYAHDIGVYDTGAVRWSNTSDSSSFDTFLYRGAAATVQMGANAAPVTNQHFKACNRITSDGVGANLTISGGNGRGGAGGSLILATYDTGASATPGTLLTRLTLDTAGMLTFANGVNMSFASTMIGGAITDALAFWGTSPVTQPAHIADPTGDSGTGLDTVDKTVLDTTLTAIQASIASINAMLAITGLTAAS